MSIGIFIAGRLGSERLPNKLILPIGESNLWDMACRKLNSIGNQYNCYVLAEEGSLVEIASQYPNLKVIVRDKRTAEVDSPLSYIFKDLKDVTDEHLMFLNPCLSFLKASTIEHSVKTFEENEWDYATSAKPFKNWLFDEQFRSVSEIDYKVLSTKDIKPLWQAAHCFHIFNREEFFETGCMLQEGLGLIEILEEETIDVDTLEDYEYVRWRHEVRI